MIWKVIKETVLFTEKCKKDKINAYSAQAAFFIILSIIPFLLVFSSLLQYTPITESMLMTIYQRALPEYISPFLISVTNEIYNRSVGIISVTAVAAVWSAGKGIQCMTDGLNAVNGIEENRNWFVLRFWAVIYTVIFLVAIVFTLVVLVFGNALSKLAISYMPILEHLSKVLNSFRGLIMLAILALFFTILFSALPNKKISFKSQLPGACICAVAWYVFSFCLSIYVDYFNGLSMYGSLTTIVLIMLWMYFCMYILLTCAEINVIFNEHFGRWLKRDKNRMKKRGRGRRTE